MSNSKVFFHDYEEPYRSFFFKVRNIYWKVEYMIKVIPLRKLRSALRDLSDYINKMAPYENLYIRKNGKGFAVGQTFLYKLSTIIRPRRTD